MKEKLIELLDNYGDDIAFCDICDRPTDDCEACKNEQLANHLLANGVIVPPCKVGQMVYKVSFVHKNVTTLKVEGFICNLAWKAHCTHLIPSWIGNQKEHIYISFSSFGKTVFLTNAEAEKALAERMQK